MASIQRYLKVEFERRALPGLTGHYKGPEKVRNNGKSVGNPRKKENVRDKETKPKVKERLRDRKQVGKRRAPSASGAIGDGSLPFKKRITKEAE